jgi:hypothetical protein
MNLLQHEKYFARIRAKYFSIHFIWGFGSQTKASRRLFSGAFDGGEAFSKL